MLLVLCVLLFEASSALLSTPTTLLRVWRTQKFSTQTHANSLQICFFRNNLHFSRLPVACTQGHAQCHTAKVISDEEEGTLHYRSQCLEDGGEIQVRQKRQGLNF
mmetsp:Transcript_6111/g.19678  ORF Transcript_6111/g.19678 Transcript_6111/m.19678 type:complete len:105 (+) Transcript_6111:30-344(+)